MAGHGVQAVVAFGELLSSMLQNAEMVKKTSTVEPPLSKSDIGKSFAQLAEIFSFSVSPELKKRNQYAVIETAVRDEFNNLLASTTIGTPSFVRLWNLLDIISILSDDEQCDPALLFWLVEELLDSQTIAGCRTIFDYLESRREKITTKHFGQKNLVILRSCNELLRRLSRAEDTAFCGRVFIFMFQSFPLGDKSSVNLRGEYHTENVTIYDELPAKVADPESMDVDSEANTEAKVSPPKANGTPGPTKATGDQGAKGVTFSIAGTPMSPDQLYPIFWSLQRDFNQPKRLFDPTNFAGFKGALEATMVMFKSVMTENSGRIAKPTDETKRGTKRKRGEGDDDLANAFNPKYLTSRDLFELEISDLSFRRHILVQVLIVMDFLLSLSVKAKDKLSKADLPDNLNKSVMYADQILSEEDTNWSLDMKKSIAEYLKQGGDGAFFSRMVETVLSRDKNWVRWKIESCPSIARPAVSPEDYVAAKASARKTALNKRLRPNPLGSLDLKFLSEDDGKGGLEKLKDPKRYQLPAIKSFKSKIELDDMDIEMARDDEAKNAAIEAKASKTWRALRIASASKLVAFDKIERSDNIDEIFHDSAKVDERLINGDDEMIDTDEPTFPKDRRPIVISGPSGVGKGTLIKMLIDKHAKVLGRRASHTTRIPKEGEVHGQHYYFIGKQEYDTLRDGDEFLEYNNFNDNDYGTSRKVVEAIVASGKVPLMEIDMHGIQQLKDKGFAARFIFLAPPNVSELQSRLAKRGTDTEEKIQEILANAQKELEHAKLEGFHDMTFVNDDLQTTYNELEKYIFGDKSESSSTVTAETKEVVMPHSDTAMKDEVSTNSMETDAPAS
ncbi:hypothetical protein B7494_g4892 [Chlorociboria aeruginascens]|nr:hypothetical protein B7494_g4892 [Chlorociboria aeruginascens]